MHPNSAVSCILLEVYRTLADKSDVMSIILYSGADPGFCKGGGHKVIFHCSFTITTSSVNKHAVTL